MRVDVLTLFPEMFSSVLGSSILGRAINNELLSVYVHNIRDYSDNKHRKADDYPFGGGSGLVMMAQPIYACVEAVQGIEPARRILLSPRGKPLNTKLAQELALEKRLLLLCGHYEGVDERVMDIIDEEISIGDYVLTGGELPAMVLIDCVSRHIPGVLGSINSTEEESFCDTLLEYPQYTRPAEIYGKSVPEILLSGHHENIQAWRKAQAVLKTQAVRPELLRELHLSKIERAELRKLISSQPDEGSKS